MLTCFEKYYELFYKTYFQHCQQYWLGEQVAAFGFLVREAREIDKNLLVSTSFADDCSGLFIFNLV